MRSVPWLDSKWHYPKWMDSEWLRSLLRSTTLVVSTGLETSSEHLHVQRPTFCRIASSLSLDSYRKIGICDSEGLFWHGFTVYHDLPSDCMLHAVWVVAFPKPTNTYHFIVFDNSIHTQEHLFIAATLSSWPPKQNAASPDDWPSLAMSILVLIEHTVLTFILLEAQNGLWAPVCRALNVKTSFSQTVPQFVLEGLNDLGSIPFLWPQIDIKAINRSKKADFQISWSCCVSRAALVEALSSGQTLHELLRRRPEIAWLTYLDHSMRLVISCDICDMNAGSLYQTQSDTII